MSRYEVVARRAFWGFCEVLDSGGSVSSMTSHSELPDETGERASVCWRHREVSADSQSGNDTWIKKVDEIATSTTLLHTDDKVVAFQDIKPAALRHYLVIPVEHIPTVNDLQRRPEDYNLVSRMLEVGRTLVERDAPQCHQYRFGFHQPPFNSVNHLHLHCFALPYTPRWKHIKYLSVGKFGFIEAEKLLEKIKPLPSQL